MSNGYRYIGNGETYRSLPPRDLSQRDFDNLGPLEQRTVTECGAYEAVVPEAPKGSESPGQPAETGTGSPEAPKGEKKGTK